MANAGVKSKTIVQEIVMMLFFFPSFVVTRTTGPGSINVNALLISNVSMQVPPYIPFRLTSYYLGRAKHTPFHFWMSKINFNTRFSKRYNLSLTIWTYNFLQIDGVPAVKISPIVRPRVRHLKNKSQFCKSLFLHSGAHQIERLEF